MPRKIRQLKADLRAAGFSERPGRGKGSHSVWIHDTHSGLSITLAGKDGGDAKDYQEKQVAEAIAKSRANEDHGA